MSLIEEFRKEKRRRDLSSDESDDDPFHNKSTAFGFGAARNRLNATPASSTIKADSIAGRSRASTIKANQRPPHERIVRIWTVAKPKEDSIVERRAGHERSARNGGHEIAAR